MIFFYLLIENIPWGNTLVKLNIYFAQTHQIKIFRNLFLFVQLVVLLSLYKKCVAKRMIYTLPRIRRIHWNTWHQTWGEKFGPFLLAERREIEKKRNFYEENKFYTLSDWFFTSFGFIPTWIEIYIRYFHRNYKTIWSFWLFSSFL